MVTKLIALNLSFNIYIMGEKQNKLIVLIVQIFIYIVLFGLIICQTLRMDKYDKQIDNYNKLIEEIQIHEELSHDCDHPWMDGDLYDNIIELNKELYHEN